MLHKQGQIRQENRVESQAKSTKTTVNITAFKVLLASISQRARSKTEIQNLTGLTNTTVSRWMRVLSSGKDRIVYVESWSRVGQRGNWTAMWKMGWGMPDAPKPKPLTSSQYNKRWRVTQKANAAIHVTKSEGVIRHVAK